MMVSIAIGSGDTELNTTIAIGKNGRSVECDWTKVPGNVMAHIAQVYFPQYITDRANSGGKDSTDDDRVALAMKKIESMYAGEIRTRTAAEPTDPVEAEWLRLATAELNKQYRNLPEYAKTSGKDRIDQVIAMRHKVDNTKPETFVDALMRFNESPDGVAMRKVAERNINARNKSAETIKSMI